MSRSPPRRSSGGSGTTAPDLGGRDGEPSVPTGIKLICALRILVNLFLFLGGLAGLGSDPLAPIVLVLAVVDLVIVYGLLTLQHWGWTWAVGLGTVNAVLLLLTADPLGAVLAGLVTIYIATKRPVYERARAFRQGERPRESDSDPEDGLIGDSR
jgi:hypothetical protein